MSIIATADTAQSLAADPPRAGSFIVTVYGDVVLPRGGALWMGALIDTCTVQGISESLVRTAVSRLVAAGQLEGERIGRRSFYRLTAAAAAEYARVGRLFYEVPEPPCGWRLALGALPPTLPAPWARLGAEAALAPDRADVADPGSTVLRVIQPPAMPGRADSGLGDFAAAHWPLTEAAEGYRRVLARFGAMGRAPEDGAGALALRLRLIHLFRQAVLRDPHLPEAALPPDWPGASARRLFLRLYLALTGAADRHIGATLRDSAGLLPAETDETRRRHALLLAGARAQGIDV